MKSTRTTKLLALLLAVMLLATFATGCGAGKPEASSAASASPVVEAEPKPAATPEPEPVAEPEPEAPYFPLAETFDTSVFMQIGDISAYIETYNDTWFYEELEARTNVHVEFSTTPAADAGVNMNIMFASGELTDLVENVNSYYGLNKAMENEMILDLTELVDSYMPNYKAVVESNDIYLKGVKDDAGRMLQVNMLREPGESPAIGLLIREDLLSQVGLTHTDLVTYDDYYEAFTAMKTELNVSSPMWISNFGSTIVDAISAGYGISTNNFGNMFQPFFQVDGEVKYGPMEDAYKDWLTMMVKWYSEGLIYPDYMSATSYFSPDATLITNNEIACWANRTGPITSYKASNPEFDIVGAASPVLKAGETAHLRARTDMVTGEGWAVAAGLDEGSVEIICRWLDYFWSEEGYTLFNWGGEGLSFTVENGKNVYTDLVVNNPDYNNTIQVSKYVYTKVSGPFLLDTHTFDSTMHPSALEAVAIWAQADDSYLIPSSISMTTDESATFGTLYADISTQVTEWTNKVIVGDADISEFDDFRALLTEMGIEDCITVKKDALDRYNAR